MLPEFVDSIGLLVIDEAHHLRLGHDFRPDYRRIAKLLPQLGADVAADGQVERVRARWLLGCDGARSQVRKGAGIPFEGETYDDACVLADVHVEWSLGQGELCLIPSTRGVMAAFPMPGRRRFRLFAVMPRDMLPEVTRRRPSRWRMQARWTAWCRCSPG